MIRLILKLAVVALLANALWHIFIVFSPHYRLVDAVQSAAQFRADLSDDGLTAKVLLLATQYGVALDEDQVKVTHDDLHTRVEIAYERRIEFAPGFAKSWPFTAHVETINSRPPPANSPK
jgi:hypothetical protein